MSGIRRVLRQIFGLAVTALFLYLAFGRLQWESVRTAMASAAPGPLFLGVLMLGADFFLRAVRWWRMLRKVNPHLFLRDCVWPFLASLAANNVLPLRAGDLYRAVGFRQGLRVSPMQVFGTLVIERLLDLLALLAFFFAGLFAAAGFPASFTRIGIWMGAVSLAALAALLLFPHRMQQVLVWGMRCRPLSGSRVAARAAEWAAQFFGSLSLLRSPALFAQLVLLSAVCWTLEGGVFAAVARSLHIDAGAFGPWFSLATGTLATLLPSTPGYVGTFDYFAMLGLLAYGASRTGAAAFALLVHALLWAPVTFVGVLYFALPGGRTAWRRVHAREGTDAGEFDA